MVNGVDSLVSLSDFSLLVYRDASDFCVLTLYPATFWLGLFNILKCSLFAGVQPPQDPGEPSGEMVLANEWMNERGMEERKRLMFLCLHREPIKPRDKELALFSEAAGTLPVSWGSEDAERLPVQVLETRAEKWTQRASVFQGISLKKKVREKKRKTRGDQASSSEAQ